MSFANGKKSRGCCDRCEFEFPYNSLREETVRGTPLGNAVCQACYDPDHPQNWYGADTVVDFEALRDPRPDINLSESRSLWGWSPVGAPGTRLTLSIGKVSVPT